MEVDSTATHGLSGRCPWSEGHHHCYAAINGIVHRALFAAHLLYNSDWSQQIFHSNGDALMVSCWYHGGAAGSIIVWDAPVLNINSCSKENCRRLPQVGQWRSQILISTCNSCSAEGNAAAALVRWELWAYIPPPHGHWTPLPKFLYSSRALYSCHSADLLSVLTYNNCIMHVFIINP